MFLGDGGSHVGSSTDGKYFNGSCEITTIELLN